jgi:hypothetical protein
MCPTRTHTVCIHYQQGSSELSLPAANRPWSVIVISSRIYFVRGARSYCRNSNRGLGLRRLTSKSLQVIVLAHFPLRKNKPIRTLLPQNAIKTELNQLCKLRNTVLHTEPEVGTHLAFQPSTSRSQHGTGICKYFFAVEALIHRPLLIDLL